jgi:hypothetical protein
MDAPTGSIIVYATAPGEVAADGLEHNGVFTKHLLKHMQQANLPIGQVLKRVRIDVATETKQRQIPWESSSLMGDFYFKTARDLKSSVIMTTDKLESSEQASIQPNVLAPPINQPQHRLSIFPILPPENPGLIPNSGRMIPFLKDSTINALAEILQNEKRFDSI